MLRGASFVTALLCGDGGSSTLSRVSSCCLPRCHAPATTPQHAASPYPALPFHSFYVLAGSLAVSAAADKNAKKKEEEAESRE